MRVVVIGMVAAIVALVGCASDDEAGSPVPSTAPAEDRPRACTEANLSVPAPVVVADGVEHPMDLLFIESVSCGYNADGAANLGAEPSVVASSEDARVVVPSGFSARYSAAAEDEPGAPLSPVEVDDEGAFPVDPTATGCVQLVVELSRGDLSGRYAARLEEPDRSPGALPSAANAGCEA